MHIATRTMALVLLALVTSCTRPDAGADADQDVEATVEADSGIETMVEADSGIETTGRIEATLGERELSWNVLSMDGESGPGSSSVYRIRPAFGDSLLILTLAGYTGVRPTVAGMISITLTVRGTPGSCPCEFLGETIEYWTGFSEMYRSTGTTITLDRLERVSGEAYRTSGSFSGTMVADGEFDGAEEPRVIEGTFSIDRIVRSEAGS